MNLWTTLAASLCRLARHGRLGLPTALLLVLLSHAGAPCAQPLAGDAHVPSAETSARFTSTFVQPLREQESWPRERWSALLDGLVSMGVHDVIIQWSVLGSTAFFASPSHKGASVPLLEMILPLAQERGMTVRLGLVHDLAWWEKIVLPVEVVRVYLKRLELDSLRTARELDAAFNGYSCFKGWYLPEEIDDTNWLTKSRQSLLADHLRNVREGLRALAPQRPVAVSGFANGFCDPKAYREFIKTLLSVSGMDAYLFQDGVGVRKLRMEDAPLYIQAAAKGARDAGALFLPVVEVFTQTEGPPLNTNPFQAVPADMSRVASQLRAAQPYARDGLVAFSLPEYALPGGSPLAAALYSSYLGYIGGKQRDSQ